MAKCIKCGLPLEEKNTCECNGEICYHCCECGEGCTCGCQEKE